MESQKIINLLNSNDIESQKFTTNSGVLLMIKILESMMIVLLLNLKLK